MIPWAHPSPQPKWHLDWFSRFAGLTDVTDRPTDHATRQCFFFLEFRLRVEVVIGLGGVKFEACRAKWRGLKSREQRWTSWAGGSQPPPHQPGGLGECYKLPSGVRSAAPAGKRFSCILSAEDDLSDISVTSNVSLCSWKIYDTIE